MRLNEVVQEILTLEESKNNLEQQLSETNQDINRLGSAVFAGVRDLGEKGKSSVAFQLGAEQYSIDANGRLNRINQLPQADIATEIELQE